MSQQIPQAIVDELVELTRFTAVGAIAGQWLMGISFQTVVVLIVLLGYEQWLNDKGNRWDSRPSKTRLSADSWRKIGVACGLLLFDFIYFIFRDWRMVAGVTTYGETNVSTGTFYSSATDYRFVTTVIAWIFKTAFSDFVMLFRASKLLHDPLPKAAYYGTLLFLLLLYLGTIAAGIITWIGLLTPSASTFDNLLENSATYFMAIHCGYNVLVTLLIVFVYWRHLSVRFEKMSLAQLALRAFSAGNLLYTLVTVVLVITYQRQLLVVYFWYDITQPLMTLSFVMPMTIAAFAKVMPLDKSARSTTQGRMGINVSVRREEEVAMDAIHNQKESSLRDKAVDWDDDNSAA